MSDANKKHRVIVEFDDGAYAAKLIHPEGGCDTASMCGQCGRSFDDTETKPCYDCEGMTTKRTFGECWVQGWFDEEGVDLLHGKVEVIVEEEYDFDHCKLHVVGAHERGDGCLIRRCSTSITSRSSAHWGVSMRLHEALGHTEPWEICEEGCDQLASDVIFMLFDQPVMKDGSRHELSCCAASTGWKRPLDALFDTLKARDRTIDGLMAELESRRHPPTPIAGTHRARHGRWSLIGRLSWKPEMSHGMHSVWPEARDRLALR